MTVRGLIFDMDGTLVDSALDFAAIRQEIGLSNRQPILEGIAQITDADRHDRALEILHRHEQQGAEQATPFPGVEQVLRELREQDYLLGVLTRNSRFATDLTFQRLGWTFSIVLTREDAPAKPDPTGLQMICRDWDLPPVEVLFVGDYLFDIQAGHDAGTGTVLFAPDVVPDYAGDADWVIRDFTELSAVLQS